MSKRTIISAIFGACICAFPVVVAAQSAQAPASPLPEPAVSPLPVDPSQPLGCKNQWAKCDVTADCCDNLQCAWNPQRSANVCWAGS